MSPEASHNIFKAYFFERLLNFDGMLDAATIVRTARLGHPAADQALRRYIEVAMEADLFHKLPVSVRDYARESLTRAQLGNRYSSKARQVADNFARNVGVCYSMDRVKTRYPEVPLLYSSKERQSAAALVGKAFELKEVQTRRIYQTDAVIAKTVAEFFAANP